MPKIITLEGEIGWELDVWDVKNALREANGEDILVNWSSPGGLVYSGLTMYNLFKNYSGNVDFHIMGMAASMGSYIPLSGNKITAEQNAIFMIHNARSFVSGDHNAMAKRAKILESLSGLLAKVYIQKTGKTEAQIKSMMDDETFLFGSEMKDAGFVDEISGEPDTDPDARDTFLAVAKESVDICMGKVSTEKPEDFEQAAALLTESIDNIDKENKKCKNAGVNHENEKTSVITPANADNDTTEDSTMNLNEYKEKFPAGAAQIAKIVQDATEAGRTEGEARINALIKKTAIAFDPEKSYPPAIQALATKVLKGESDPAALEGAITMLDSQEELRKSEAAKLESENLKDTPNATDEENIDGVAKTTEDVIALAKADKGGA